MAMDSPTRGCIQELEGPSKTIISTFKVKGIDIQSQHPGALSVLSGNSQGMRQGARLHVVQLPARAREKLCTRSEKQPRVIESLSLCPCTIKLFSPTPAQNVAPQTPGHLLENFRKGLSPPAGD